jgi:hypothetical protein
MAAPRICAKLCKGVDNTGPKWIEMNIPHELKQVDFGVAEDRLVTILEQVACPGMTTIEHQRITCQEFGHELGQRNLSSLDYEVIVVGHQHPGETSGTAFSHHPCCP